MCEAFAFLWGSPFIDRKEENLPALRSSTVTLVQLEELDSDSDSDAVGVPEKSSSTELFESLKIKPESPNIRKMSLWALLFIFWISTICLFANSPQRSKSISAAVVSGNHVRTVCPHGRRNYQDNWGKPLSRVKPKVPPDIDLNSQRPPLILQSRADCPIGGTSLFSDLNQHNGLFGYFLHKLCYANDMDLFQPLPNRSRVSADAIDKCTTKNESGQFFIHGHHIQSPSSLYQGMKHNPPTAPPHPQPPDLVQNSSMVVILTSHNNDFHYLAPIIGHAKEKTTHFIGAPIAGSMIVMPRIEVPPDISALPTQ